MSDFSSERPNVSGKLLSFLNHAYEAPFDPGNFDQVIESAADYLFSSQENSAPAQHVLLGSHDQLFVPHADRLQRLLEAHEPGSRTRPASMVKDRLAALVIAPNGTCLGNSNAASLFGVDFPCRMSALSLAGPSQDQLRQLLTDTAQLRPLDTDCVLLELAAGDRFVARVTQHQSVDPKTGRSSSGIALTIARIQWDADSLPLIRGAFDLSASEAEVLLEILRGRSHAEIGEIRGRSVETIRSQAKAILGKSGFARMPQLIALMNQLALFSEPHVATADAATDGRTASERHIHDLDLPDQRRLSYHRHGQPGGVPVLFVHGYITGPYFNAPLSRGFSDLGLDVLAPSRPGFGQTSAPVDWDRFDDVVVEDALALCRATFDQPVIVVAHQGGVSHACRIALALGADCRGMLMVSAGIPIDEARHLSHMNLQTRIAAIAARHAPSMYAMLLRIGIAQFNRIGHVAYLRKYFQNSDADMVALERPDILDIYRRNVHHMIAQGTRHMVHDGRAAMADWGSDYAALKMPVHWLHGSADPTMAIEFVHEWAEAHGHGPVDVIEDGANSMLWLYPDRVLSALSRLLSATETRRRAG